MAALPVFMLAITAVSNVLSRGPDPNGVLIKPLSDRLVALTFDDAPTFTIRDVVPVGTSTVTAQDGFTQVYTVAVISSGPKVFGWSKAEAGKWSEGSRWNAGSPLVPAGRPDYVLNFNTGGTLELKFKGQINSSKLTLDGKPQPPEISSATSTPGFLTGAGNLHVHQ